jgi:hypothetical protein
MIRRLDKWCDNLWIYFSCIVGIITAIWLCINWETLSLGVKGCAFVAIIMPLHVIEEWKFPGGLHLFYNTLFGKKMGTKHLDKYPMSRFTDMVTNLVMQIFPLLFILLLKPAKLSNEFAVCIMLFSFIEVVAHTTAGTICLIWYHKKGKRTIYNPGFATAYLMFLPAGIYLLTNMPQLTINNWVGGIIALVIYIICCIPLSEFPYRKWVLKQDAFGFKSTKYFSKFL